MENEYLFLKMVEKKIWHKTHHYVNDETVGQKLTC